MSARAKAVADHLMQGLTSRQVSYDEIVEAVAAQSVAGFSWDGFTVHGDKASIDAVMSLVSIEASRKAMPPQRFEAEPEPDFGKALKRAQDAVFEALAIGGSGRLRAMDEACVYFVNHFGNFAVDRRAARPAHQPMEVAEALRIPPLNDDLRAILGMMCFQFIGIAAAWRTAGADIPKKAEAEQAYCLHWLLTVYSKHGISWRDAADAELKAALTTGGHDHAH